MTDRLTPTPSSFDELTQARRHRVRRSRRRALIIGLITLLMSLVTLVVLVAVVLSGVPPMRLAFLSETTFATTTRARALIVQHGQALALPAAGMFVPLVREGDRVAKGEVVALAVPSSEASLLTEARALRSRLARRALDQSDRAVGTARRSVDDAFNRLRIASSSGALVDRGDDVSRIDATLMPATLDVTSEGWGIETDKDTTRYRDIRRDLIARCPKIVVDTTGVVAFRVYDHLATDAILAETKRLTADRFLGPGSRRVAPFQAYETGTKVMTLLTTDTPYVALRLEGKTRDDFDATDPVLRLRSVRDGHVETIALSYAIESQGHLTVSGILPALAERWRLAGALDVDCLWSQTKGLSVPVRSLLDYKASDGVATWLKVESGRVHGVPVFVTAINGDDALITGRQGDPLAPHLNDVYVSNPRTAWKGRFLDE